MDLTGKTLGPYQVLTRLGAGGMGEVWLARDPRLEREVALKVLPGTVAGDPEQLARFRREALALAALNHPNIATIHGLESLEDGTPLLVMERVEGETLASRLRSGPLPPPEALRVTARIAEALEVAHERGVIHRDLKPGNVMVGARGLVKVLDFGLARAADRRDSPALDADTIGPATLALDVIARRHAAAAAERAAAERAEAAHTLPPSPRTRASLEALTQAGAISGTPGYMSPEQARGEPQDARTDVFSFGSVLYECLSGRRAFLGDDAWDTMQRTITTEPDLGALPPATPAPVRALVASCLEKSPERRPASMREAREAIEAALGAAPAARAADVPNNLPRSLTTFVGRAAELATAEANLERTRLLTLTGVGGCGKTRLALELAAQRRAHHPDGVWFADLARVTDESRVPDALATALGLREEPGRTIEDAVVAHLAGRRALVLIDNCEHVLEACSTLVQRLLESAPAVTVIATSREGLGVAGELLQAVPSLGLPPRGASQASALAASEAVRLFVERAGAVQAGFALDDANAAAVAEICRRLDGIPLALELAAARVRVLSVEQIRARLDDRFRLLTGGARTALPRHQTLHAALQWSWDQLHDTERDLLRTLAVFSGGWTFDAVSAVTPAEDDEFEVLDLLAHLVDKSLVVVDRDERGDVRYRFLESVRQFALDQLDASGDGDALRERHLRHFLALAETSEKHLTGPRQHEWFQRLEAEQENLLQALAWTAHVPDGATLALRLAGSVWRFWSARGHYELGRRAMEDALARPGADAPTAERARALVRSAGLALYQGDGDVAQPRIEESLAIYRALGDRKGVARALAALATAAAYREDDDTFERTNRESLELYRELGERRGLALAYHNLGFLSWCRDDHASAREHFGEALAILRQIGDREQQALTLAGLAEALFRLGDRAAAAKCYAESLELALALEAKLEACYALEGTADLAQAVGDARTSARWFGTAEAYRREAGSPPLPRERRQREATLGRLAAALGPAAYEAARSEGGGQPIESACREALDWLSRPSPGFAGSNPDHS